jgi:hypothetical protein
MVKKTASLYIFNIKALRLLRLNFLMVKKISTQYYDDSDCYMDGGTTCDPWDTKFDDGKFVFGVNLVFSHIF